jgi:hypothetical protein
MEDIADTEAVRIENMAYNPNSTAACLIDRMEVGGPKRSDGCSC